MVAFIKYCTLKDYELNIRILSGVHGTVAAIDAY